MEGLFTYGKEKFNGAFEVYAEAGAWVYALGFFNLDEKVLQKVINVT